MSHHGREDEVDVVELEARASYYSNQLGKAIEFIRSIAFDMGSDAGLTSAAVWLDENGYDGPLGRAKAAKARIERIDAQIEELRREREELSNRGKKQT